MEGKGNVMRRCGDCTECCKVMDVKELDKELFQDCEHRTDKGCSRYGTRPEACMRWYCGWAAGLGKGSCRPDKIGVVWDGTEIGPVTLFKAYKTRRTFRGERMIEDMTRDHVVMIVTRTERTFKGPEEPTLFVIETLNQAAASEDK